MTFKRKSKIYKRKILKKVVKDFVYKIVNGTSYSDPIGLIPKSLQEVILKGDADDR